MTTTLTPAEADRFWSKVVRDPSGCWIWNSARQPKGYGLFWLRRKYLLAHRLMYVTQVGPIPDGYEIDHLCRVRYCVNPAHLEAVTRRENQRRGIAPWAENARRTECKHGHPFDEANTRIAPNGSRVCRECERTKIKRRRAAAKRAA